MKRVLIFFLALVMLIGVLAACGPKQNGPEERKPVEQDTSADQYLPKADYSGKTYTVLYRQGQFYEEEWISDDSRHGDVINDAIAQRNQAVIDRYGVKLDYETGKTSTDFENVFWPKVLNNVEDDTFQLIAGQTYRLATVSVQGYCLNWLNEDQVPEVDTTAEWWDGDFIQAAKYNNCTYIATGPLSLTDMHSSACMYFNKTLFNAFMSGKSMSDGYDTPTAALFDLVRNGGWTLDKLIEFAKDCTDKIEGAEDDEDAVYGLATNQNNQIDAYIYASGITMTERKNGTIQLKKVDNSNPILALAQKLQDFHQSSGNVVMFPSGVNPERVYKFVTGNAVFCTGVLDSARTIQIYAPEMLYGVIPYPKYDETQKEYHTYKIDYKTGFCIPRAVYKHGNQEFVGTITEALAYYSNKFVKPALYEKVLTHKNVQDKDSSDCVTMILNGGLYEFANIYAFAWGDQQSPAHLLRYIVQNKGSDFSTEYRNKYLNGNGPYQKSLDKLLKDFRSDDVSADDNAPAAD